jgi:hypothetical protein
MDKEAGAFRERVYPSFSTLGLFIGQDLSTDGGERITNPEVTPHYSRQRPWPVRLPFFVNTPSMSGPYAQIVAGAKVPGSCSVGVLCGTPLAALFLSSPRLIFFQGSKRLPRLHRKMVLD